MWYNVQQVIVGNNHEFTISDMIEGHLSDPNDICLWVSVLYCVMADTTPYYTTDRLFYVEAITFLLDYLRLADRQYSSL